MNRFISSIARTLSALLVSSFLLFTIDGEAVAQVARKSEVVSLKEGLKQMLQQEGP